MRFYELFGLAPKLDIDEKKIKEKFFLLSRSVHPDFFTLSSVEEQMEAMEKSTMLNDAYKTLKEENSRIRYILTEKGLLSEDEKEQMPMDFLMEMMDLNESIAEARAGENQEEIAKLTREIDQLANEWTKELEDFRQKEFNQWTEKQWLELKSYYLKLRYLRRLKQQLEGSSEM
jgi:molecular chaperone HscB